jgi:hypothetical protein
LRQEHCKGFATPLQRFLENPNPIGVIWISNIYVHFQFRTCGLLNVERVNTTHTNTRRKVRTPRQQAFDPTIQRFKQPTAVCRMSDLPRLFGISRTTGYVLVKAQKIKTAPARETEEEKRGRFVSVASVRAYIQSRTV